MDKARVQAELQRIGRNIADILQENFVGFYVTGSFARGTWNPQSSDLDFLVVVQHPIKPGEDAALQKLHVERLSLQVTMQELNEAVYEMLMEDSKKLASATDFEKVVYLLIDSLRCIYTLRTGQLPTKQIAIAFNRDLLGSALYANLTKFQQGLLPHFALSKAEVRAILDYGLSLNHNAKS